MRAAGRSRSGTAARTPGGRRRGAGSRSRRGGRSWLVAALVLFAATRLYLLGPFEPRLTTVGLYGRYAVEWTFAAREGTNVYEVHDRFAERAARASGAGATRQQRTIEYPPLALIAIVAPMALAGDPLPAGAGPPSPEALQGKVNAYPDAYRRLCALFDTACFLLLVFALRRRPGLEAALRLSFYTLATLLLAHLLYERLDVILGALLAAALVVLVSVRGWMWSLSALALASAFKLAPVVAAPVWALGGLGVAGVRAASWPAVLGRVALRVLVAAGLLVASFVPFYFSWGPRTLDFLGYHGTRGIQIESVFASVLLLLRGAGMPVTIEQAFGAWNLASPLSGAMSALSPVLVAIAVAGVSLAAIAWVRRHGAEDAPTAAMADPGRFAGFAALALLAAMVFSKVLSPQYLLWIAPLLALAPVRGRTGRVAAAVALAVFALTGAIYPHLYFDHVLGVPAGTPLRGAAPAGTTALGTMLLVARNAGLVLLGVLLARLCFAGPDAGAARAAEASADR